MEINQEILIDYLDGKLSPELSGEVAAAIKENPETKAEWICLKLAIDAVSEDSIRQQVSAVRRSFENNQTLSQSKTKVVSFSFYKTGLRIAAVLVLLAGITFLYKYVTLSGQSLYEKQFAPYELSNVRGQADTSGLSEAYESGDWKEVEKIYQIQSVKTHKSAFLAGVAEMQQNQFPQAVHIFESLLTQIKNTGDDAFREETEYYLSLAYLHNHEVGKGLDLIDKIKADPSHRYYPLLSKLSPIDLKIIALKK
jgi:hypothetical protein